MAVTKNISLDYQDVIVIGRRGENEAVDIVWDISPLVAEFGGGTALVLAKRATDESAYPVTLTEQTDTTLTWTVSSVDSCVIGVGKVQLFWYVGNVLAKSFMWRTFVGDDITGMVGDPPEAYESWLEHLAEMGADILNDAKDEVKNAEAWAVGERGGEPVVDGDETYHNNSKYWSGVSSDYAGNAESSADAAEQSAGDAAHQVELAEAQVTLAEGQVALAQQKVQDAAAQVTLATEQAQAAASKATEASGYATDASGSATDAETYKTQAQGFSQDAGADAALALGYKNAAQTYAGNASTSATNAADSASAASTSATNASTSATNAANSATAAAASATSAAESAAHLVIDDELSTESENAVQNKLITTALETKAEVDGAYEQMTVGNAEQLVSSVGIEDSVPYNFRTSGGSADIGDREVDKIVGGTVAWNQLVPLASGTVSPNGGTKTFDSASGEYTIVCTNITTNSFGYWITGSSFKAKGNHKTLVMSSWKPSVALSNVRIGTDAQNRMFSNLPANAYTELSTIIAPSADSVITNYSNLNNLSLESLTVIVKNIMCFDLTQMFGSTIADYIYALETANAGAGVAWFRKLFPKPYYAYNAGELMSVQTSAHKMVGFNAWDEVAESGYINPSTGQPASASGYSRSKNFSPCVPSMNYYFACSESQDTTVVLFYDANENYISYLGGRDVKNRVFTTPANAAFFKIYFKDSGYNHDICINLSWDGERDGEYEEYKQWVYPLDSDLVLRGIPKLSSGNDLYYDGDEYESDGTVTRRYGIVDLGTLSYIYDATVPRFYSTNLGKGAESDKIANAVCPIYEGTTFNKLYASEKKNMTMNVNASGTLSIINTAYTDAAAFKTAMSGVYLAYELAEPTTESADPYQNPQIVSDWGTEEYVDSRDVQVPVGHETHYAVNLRAKLEMAPNSPSGSGLWVVKQTNGINEYVPLLFPASDIPAPPTDDGSYVLAVTVSGGTATYSWASST